MRKGSATRATRYISNVSLNLCRETDSTRQTRRTIPICTHVLIQPRNNSVFTVIDAPAQPTASILSRDVSFQSILVPLTPSRLIIALYSRPKSKLLHLKNLYSLPGINDFVEIVEWICPMREIYREFYHFIAWQIKSFDETASKILFPSLFFLVAILNSGGKVE